MSDSVKRPRSGRRTAKNSFTTRSGKTIKVSQSIGQRRKASREERASAKAAYLSSLPKNRALRILYRLHPKRVAKYWFSRKGAIMALKLSGVGIFVMFLLIMGVFAYFRKDAPKIKDLSGEKLGGSVTYYDRSHSKILWQDYDAVKRQPVRDDQISQYMKDATVAVEDKDFFKHGAFDTRGIMRAAVNNVFGIGGGGTQGGSTITQQLVKLDQDWTNNRTITRKVKELILAVDLERQYSKQDILTGYLNLAPYGPVEYGVEVAAKDYFGKSAKDLSLAEASMLAAIPQAPAVYSKYGPYFDSERLIGRQHYVLDLMLEQGYIKKEEAEAAKQVDILAQVKPLSAKYSGIQAPYFVLAAKAELESRFGSQTVRRGGWEVTTTLDLRLQKLAEDQVAAGMGQIISQKGDTAAFAAMDVQTGQMVALVGNDTFSAKEEAGQYNFAQSNLPPGSTFKPYDYAALIEHSTNVGAGTVLYDSQGPIPGYECTRKARPTAANLKGPNPPNCLWDYDFRYPGALTLRYALGGSRNVTAVKAMTITGVDKTIETASKIMTGESKGAYKCFASGIDISAAQKSDEIDCNPSSAIGDGAYLNLDNHVSGYATLSRYGEYLPKTYILRVKDASGKVLDEWKKPKGKQAVRPDTAFIVSDMLSDPKASYFASYKKPHRFNTSLGTWHFGMKTGTTNDSKDGWMMGMSTKYAAGVWVGHHTGNPYCPARSRVGMCGTMEAMTLPIWNGWMKEAHRPIKPENWKKPSTVKTAAAYVVRTHVGLGSIEPSPSTDYYPSWYAKKTVKASSQTIDKVSGKLATSCTPERAKETQYNGNDNSFSADIYVGSGRNATTSLAQVTATDDIHNCNDTMPSINLTSPITCSDAGTCSFTVTVQQGTHALTSDKFPGTVVLLVNNQAVKTINIPANNPVYTTTISYVPSKSATATVAAQVVDSVLYDATSSSATVKFDLTKDKKNEETPNPEEDEDTIPEAPAGP